MKLLSIFCLGFLFAFSSLFGQTNGIQTIEKAKKENKYLLMFFYKEQNEKTTHAKAVFDQSLQQLGEQVHSIQINVNDPLESQVVEKFDLKRTPMPFVLSLAPNGAITGGFPLMFTEQQLIDSIVSDGAAHCLKALQDRKLVFLCLQNPQTKGNEQALHGVRDFKSDPRFGNATEIVFINPSDEREHHFLNQLGVDKKSSEAITLFMAPPSEIVGRYTGSTNKDQLISDLKKATSGCCGPGGCCPGGRCK